MRDVEVVITGTGLFGHLGNRDETLSHVRAGTAKDWQSYQLAVELGCRCSLVGLIDDSRLTDQMLEIDRRASRFMGKAARAALSAVREALAEAGVSDPSPAALLFASGAGDTATHIEQYERLEQHQSARRVRPTVVPRLMASTVSANLAQILHIRGPSASVAAACAGGAWNILVATSLIRSGAVAQAIAGGCEILDIHFHTGFDAMRAYCPDDQGGPQRASRPYAADRAGFIFGEGAGALFLESRESAEQRGANILGIVRGCGASSDGTGEMVKPSREGARRSMEAALRDAGLGVQDIDYVNTHATSTPTGDVEEAMAVHGLFGPEIKYSSTKGYTGHMVSGAGAAEAVISLKMLQSGVAPGCRFAEPLDPALAAFQPLLRTTPMTGRTFLSNSFGFGGTNVSLIIEAVS